MSYTFSDIAYETASHFILRGNGWEVWENGAVYPTRRGSFGSKSNMSQEWLDKAKAFIVRIEQQGYIRSKRSSERTSVMRLLKRP